MKRIKYTPDAADKLRDMKSTISAQYGSKKAKVCHKLEEILNLWHVFIVCDILETTNASCLKRGIIGCYQAPEGVGEWESFFNQKMNRKIENYQKCPLKYENGECDYEPYNHSGCNTCTLGSYRWT